VAIINNLSSDSKAIYDQIKDKGELMEMTGSLRKTDVKQKTKKEDVKFN